MDDTSAKKIGLIAATAMVTGNMMGSGIALLPSYLATIGSVTTLSWVATILGALALGYIFAQLGLMNPQAGGPIAYAEEVSPIFGFQAGILYFYANWVGNIGMAVTGVAYLSNFFPILTHSFAASIAGIIAIWVLAGINLLGAKWVAKLAIIGVTLMLVPVVLTGTYGWLFFHSSTFIANWNVSTTNSLHAFSSGITLCLWSFVGLESAATNTSIINDPQKTVPRATLIGISICALVYLLSTTVIEGMFPAKVLAASGAPFAMAAGMLIGHWIEPFVSFFTAFACFASLGSWMLLLTQAGVKAAHGQILPAAFGKVNKNNIPAQGLLITAIAMSLLLLVLAHFSNSAQALFGHIVSIAILLLMFPYFYAILNFTKKVVTSPQHKRLRNTICILAALFCFAAFCGAQKKSLETALVIYLSIFFFYQHKNRASFTNNIDKE